MSLTDHTWVYPNEVTHGWPLDNFRMGTGHQKDQPYNLRAEILRQLDSGEGKGAEDWVQSRNQQFHQSCLQNEEPHYRSWTPSLLELLVGQHMDVLGEGRVLVPWGGARRLCIQDSPRTCPSFLFIWLCLDCIPHTVRKYSAFPSSVSHSSKLPN